ncbi:NAD(P)-dependent alcohol dehydrogenase [Thiomicrorhabdus sp. ZW0627]|uniref:NAD(P)-dependent alcohol dehydrogenase n=1 Tax=Thiomicrorhabdus sp. ZW0627 TaxID=3039774 RepID=UPI0024370E36|nr:NAD(P)-dependent alcohol dehydrogenase [Thiomicrorhabdus sp. ZW0627]MDG6773250.1 NAD(P)-dependent alcohol dehydrogenase [Thiomicrorhabdus sp. ZW0627]
MKAIVWTAYGAPDVLQMQEVETPVPKENEVLVKILATTVETGDCEMRRYHMHNRLLYIMRPLFGLFKPRIKILGQQLAGEVEAVGQKVTRFKPGDPVFGVPNFSFGTYAEYKCLKETAPLSIKPDNLSFEEACCVPVGGTNALHFLKIANIQPGESVLIYGSTGTIGTYAVQLAKHFGAEVTAVCSSMKTDLVKSLGADHVIDYTKEDFTQVNRHYDVIFDTIGKSPFSWCLDSLKPHGRYLLANPTVSELARGIWTNLIGNKRILTKLAKYTQDDLEYLKALMEDGKLRTVIDRVYPLEEIAEAHRYVEQRHKTGNVVIRIQANTHETIPTGPMQS